MTDYELNPNVCPSSLDDKGNPTDPSETAHKWDETTDPIVCSECGAEREPVTKGRALSIMSDLIDYYLEGYPEDEVRIEVLEMQRYMRDNLK